VGAFEIMDTALLVWMNDWRHPALIASMSAITWLGSLLFLLPLALVVGWSSNGGRDWRNWTFLPAAVLGAAITGHALKWFIDRDRPDIFPSLVPLPADASFPSAHTLQITAFVVAWLISTRRWRRVAQVVAGVVLIMTTGFSRLYLQVHFPSDVLFGILGGLLWVWFLYRLPVWRNA
jgi:membrane-associated phospholipid phosphatase